MREPPQNDHSEVLQDVVMTGVGLRSRKRPGARYE